MVGEPVHHFTISGDLHGLQTQKNLHSTPRTTATLYTGTLLPRSQCMQINLPHLLAINIAVNWAPKYYAFPLPEIIWLGPHKMHVSFLPAGTVQEIKNSFAYLSPHGNWHPVVLWKTSAHAGSLLIQSWEHKLWHLWFYMAQHAFSAFVLWKSRHTKLLTKLDRSQVLPLTEELKMSFGWTHDTYGGLHPLAHHLCRSGQMPSSNKFPFYSYMRLLG